MNTTNTTKTTSQIKAFIKARQSNPQGGVTANCIAAWLGVSSFSVEFILLDIVRNDPHHGPDRLDCWVNQITLRGLRWFITTK